MPRTFQVQVQADRYPVTMTVEASNWATAAARAIRQWAKQNGKGSRTDTLSIRLIKSNVKLAQE